ncbi:hypothetical protein GALMADRAFT_630074 [Galerina marginata CBS 339.88]|uniref:ABM domain-containing protein n=1 Tax=Galerina marginata (strain CBS 339.88) TaxID=685588 RepID=A0A067T3X1_GALM3|nr:hypothetical protein GALMADRAFT_630074 [Galerina marginata CBS 339.88]
MPVTEFATLRIKEPHTIQLETLRQHLHSLGEAQAAWSGYPLTFYSDYKDVSLIHLVTGWKDVEAHMKWIVGEENQKFREIFEQFLSVDGLAHIDIDFAQIPSDARALTCKKSVVSVEGSQTEQVATGSERLWAGQGEDLEKQKAFYQFEAYNDGILQHATNTEGTELKIMTRLSLP